MENVPPLKTAHQPCVAEVKLQAGISAPELVFTDKTEVQEKSPAKSNTSAPDPSE
jgi:hypothetical protein